MTSDIDIAVWGIPANQYFLAATAANEFDEAFRVDVVDVKFCRPSLLKVIEEEGIGREPKKCGKRPVKGCYLPETNGLPLLRPC